MLNYKTFIMEIKILNTHDLRNEEHHGFNTEFNDLIIVFTPAALGIEAKYTEFLPLYNNETEALDVIRKSDKTAKLSVADHKRDDTTSGFKCMVEGYTYHFVDKKREAAERLEIVLDSFSGINRKGYAAQTSATDKLVDVLLSDYSEDLALLKLSEWVVELKANNGAFKDLSDERYSDDATKTSLKMKDVREEIDDAYRKITNLINALVLVNGPEAYTPFIKELNQRIEKYNLIIAQRKGRSNKDDED